ncbi:MULTISPECIES: ABC transporter substrate-binding protein [unclassified Thermoactinomyces]|jgi:multiple sugar transport system substrate-binding protein|uniref:ABC transporter substrate-binding protein n=1 Tax=unclassified Thermoactinomyces TaxID=2634588 RepID=UPI0018DB0509|nr:MULTISPECIES: ABC transporter substrate-binding protein [unclassified Thermoactinomyces]MBH8599202.1 extracellular solute-binding protein [Thermoactinomyces sp. CICC 10523]MBH8605377.1 extracellular solute-binding protein [Thermoactinomyces sp. CICC 10522]
MSLFRQFLAILLLTSLVLTGCAAGGSSSKKEIRIGAALSSPAEKQILEAQVNEFKKEHAGVDVKIESLTDDYLKEIQTMIGAHKEPDIFYLDSMYAPDLIRYQVLEPLDPYIKKEKVNLNDFEDSLVRAFQKNGHTYGIPKDYNTLALFYNKKILKEKGVAVPKTWDELRAAAKALTTSEHKGLVINPELARFQPFLYQNGGKVIDDQGKPDLNSPQNREALQFFTDLFTKDHSADTPKNMGFQWSGDAFAEGKSAMVIEGGWLIPFLKEKAPDLDYGIAELPVKAAGKPNSNLAFTVAYVMSKRSEHKDIAFQLINFLTSEKGQSYVVKSGLALPSRKAMGEKFIQTYPERAAFVNGAKYAQPFQYGDAGSALVDAVNKAAESLVLGQEHDVARALAAAEQQANKKQ